jgi:molybdate transport system ATP-binding protein
MKLEVDQRLPMPLRGRLRVGAGELVALVGPSGAGKTSMLRVAAGLMRPQSGHVRVGEEVWCDTVTGVFLPPQRRHVGLVFQSYALMPHLSARDNVALALLHLPRPARELAASAWLERVGLDAPVQARRPDALSGGQQQRVAVARALAREPRVLLLDEPFSAVDLMNRRALYDLLAGLKRDLGIPMLLVTHDLQEARMLADRLVVIDQGEIQQEGTPEAIHRAPRNARVADLVGIQNRFHGIWLGPADAPGWGRLRWQSHGGGVDGPVLRVRDKGRLEAGQAVTWVIPGEGIRLLQAVDAQPTDHVAYVVESRALGEITLATLALDVLTGVNMRLTLAGSEGRGVVAGQRLAVRLDPGLVHVMPVRLG